jgi:hypothetical protein
VRGASEKPERRSPLWEQKPGYVRPGAFVNLLFGKGKEGKTEEDGCTLAPWTPDVIVSFEDK